ncbi:MAG: single-stranded DNA-binding protein [Candidatus Improbicoccus pseudotrichonymphae]|uniref:Single-stranded DNA-binding protein n=1 Tax=Candidatus Improbicoccus pseudotrichonymphae TaxID=3033792 RepID=A0AA48KZ11_9FIRM|nr:MAG: single-stranded DNA-binding protein [Candidatus Improbicoccus pseudotrichonymphae]
MLNLVAMIGRLTANPELRHTLNDLPMTRFSIAVQRSYAQQGKERQTDFFDVIAWRSTAEFVCNYFGKGQLIAVEGSMQTRTYQDANGVKRKIYEIIASNIHFVESKNSGNASTSSDDEVPPPDEAPYSSGSDQDFMSSGDADNDLPF